MAITAEQLSDLQNDAALGDDELVFSDEELERIWERVSGTSSATVQHEAALALIYRQLLANAVKLHKWKAGASEEELQQVYDHLKDMYDMYEPALEEALSISAQVSISTIRPIPNQDRTFPSGDTHSNWVNDDSNFPPLPR